MIDSRKPKWEMKVKERSVTWDKEDDMTTPQSKLYQLATETEDVTWFK